MPEPPVLFISRKLSADSPLRSWAYRNACGLIDRSLITFAALDFTAPAEADWWFFYSRRAVRFAGPVTPGAKIAAIGPATAAALLESGVGVDFCGDGHPRRAAADFLAVAEGQRVFFPRARQSRLSVQTALTDRVTVLDAVCYDNRPVPPSAPIPASIYVFTSPLNVAAYLDRWPLEPGARLLAIGPSTGAALRERGLEVSWPEEPSEASLVRLL